MSEKSKPIEDVTASPEQIEAERRARAAVDAADAAATPKGIQAEPKKKAPATKKPAAKKPAAKKPAAKKSTPKASKPDEKTRPMSARPSEYTVQDETHYSEVADKFGYSNYRELGAFNGVHNSRYDLKRGQVVKFPIKPLPGS